MTTIYKRTKRIMLIGLTGAGKSRLGNKLSETINFQESDGIESCTDKIQKTDNSEIQIIDTPGLGDTNGKEKDKKNISLIFNEIKNEESRPNVLAYVQKSSDKRFGCYSKEVIKKICGFFNSNSSLEHFIIIFTFANVISKKSKKQSFAEEFSKNILDIFKNYHGNNTSNDKSTIRNKLKYFFVELNDDDDINLDQDTLDNFRNIKKLIQEMPPLSNINEKIIIEKKITKTNCEERIKLEPHYIHDNLGGIKSFAAQVGSTTNALVTPFIAPFAAVDALAAIGVTALGPAALVGAATFGVVGLLTTALKNEVDEKVENGEFNTKLDDEHLLEYYITYDEETTYFSNGDQCIKRINENKHSRIISK